MKRRTPAPRTKAKRSRHEAGQSVPVDAIARNTLRLFAQTMVRGGYSAKELTAQFERYVASAPRPRTRKAINPDPVFHDTGHVLTLWESDPDYVDEEGKPRALPIRGPAPSVEALVKRARPTLPLEEALDFFRRTHALRKVGRKLIPTDESIIHSPQSKTQSTHHLLVLNQLLRNFAFNAKVRPGDPRWTQRVVESPNFPVNELPFLIAEVAERANRFLKSYDHSLARIARRAPPDTARVRAAINLFFAVDPPARSRTRRSAPPRSS